MKRYMILFSVFLMISMMVFAAGPKTYQVTGPVLDIKADVITVRKGADRWEIARDKTTKITGDLKVGSKVTIEYQMTATSIVVKPAATATAKPAQPPKK
jgi:cytochrome c oxidase assembly protein Cox11